MRNHGSRALMENTPAYPGTGVFWASRPSPVHILCRSTACYSPLPHTKETRGRGAPRGRDMVSFLCTTVNECHATTQNACTSRHADTNLE